MKRKPVNRAKCMSCGEEAIFMYWIETEGWTPFCKEHFIDFMEKLRKAQLEMN